MPTLGGSVEGSDMATTKCGLPFSPTRSCACTMDNVSFHSHNYMYELYINNSQHYIVITLIPHKLRKSKMMHSYGSQVRW